MSREAKTVSELCREALELRGKSLIKGRVRVDKDGDLVCDSFSSIPNSAHVLASSSGDYVLMEENAELFAFAANHIKQIAERCLKLEAENEKLREALEKAKEMNDHLFDVKKKPVNWGSTFVDWGIIDQSMLAVDQALKDGQGE